MTRSLLSRTRAASAGCLAQPVRHWLLTLLAVLAGAAGALAQTVTIGATVVPPVSPATSSYFYGPIYRSTAVSAFNYSRYAHLYTAAELGIPSGATITQLEWLKANNGIVTGSNNSLAVLLSNSTATALTDGSTWGTLTAGATSVYSSTTQDITGAAGSYLAVPTTGFTYTGGSLLVLTDWTKNGNASGAVNFVANPATGQGIGFAAAIALTSSTALTAATYGDRRPTLRITYVPGAPCTAPPTAGTAVASATSTCTGGSVVLILSGATLGSGLTYQWQSSPTGAAGSYTAIAGATAGSYTTPALTQTRYYRALVTCSGQTATSAATQVTVLAPTYATLPYTQTFEATWLSRCSTNEAPDESWLNTPTTGDNSWRRDDDGASANWTSSNGVYSLTGSDANGASSLHSARFHNYDSSLGSIGTLDLYVNLSGGPVAPTLQFDYRNAEANDVKVLLSTDGGATFPTTLQTLSSNSAWTSYQLTLPATVTATSVIRFQATSNYGFADNGLDNVHVSYITCAQPTGLAATTTSAGATASASLTFTPVAGAAGYTLSLTPAVAGAPTTVTASPISLTGLAYNTTYTATLTTNCGSSTSQPTTITFSTPCTTPAYAALPYSQDFEATWLSRCGTREVPDGSWLNTPTTGNNSWRRDDDGASANWVAPGGGAYTPAGSTGSHSARFHSFNVPAGVTGSLDLYVNLSAAGSKLLTFDYVNNSMLSSKLDVLLSTDGGLTFSATPLPTMTTASAFTAQSVLLTTTSATAVLRFQATGDYGNYDLGIDNVQLRVQSGVDLAATSLATPTATQGCYGSAEAVAVVISNAGGQAISFATNPATVTAVVTLPGGTTQTLTATVTTGTLAAAATQTVTLTPTLNMSATGTYSFAITATATGDTNPANDVLTPAPTRTVAAPVAGTLSPLTTSLCQSGTATLTLTGAANGSIQLQRSPDNVTFVDVAGATSATYTTPTLTATTYYRVQVRCGTRTATSNVSTITVSNPQVASTNSPQAICAGGPATITATASAGSTIRFFGTATGGTALATTTPGSYTTPALTASTAYYAEAFNLVGSTECVSARTVIQVTVTPNPAQPTITTTGTPGTGITLTSSAATGNQWYLNGVAIPGATSQTYLVNSGARNGSYTVVASSAGCASAPSAAVAVTVTATTAAQRIGLTLHPNPTPTGLVTLELAGSTSPTELMVLDALGRKVLTRQLPANASLYELDLSGTTSGVYLLRLRNADGVATRRLTRE